MLDGQPVNEAAVMFVPLEHGRRKTGTAIVDGKYALPAQEGLLPGTYRVEIVDNPPLDSADHTSTPSLPAKLKKRRSLPATYQHKSPLRLEEPPAELAPDDCKRTSN